MLKLVRVAEMLDGASQVAEGTERFSNQYTGS